MFLIFVLSLLPGLGFLVLQQRRRAALAILLILGPLGVSCFPALGWVTDFSGMVAEILWLAELYFWADTAQLFHKRSRPGFEAAKALKPISFPPNLITDEDRQA